MNRTSVSLLAATALGFTANLSAQSLILGYNFDEANSGQIVNSTNPVQPISSGSVNDVVGRVLGTGNNVTFISSTPGGHSNGAISINTQNSYLMAGTTTGTPAGFNGLDGALDNLTAFTFSFWVKFDSGDAASFALNDRLMGAGGRQFGVFVTAPTDGSAPTTSNFGLSLDLNGASGGEFKQGGSAVSLDASEWLFIAVSVQMGSSGYAKLFAGTETGPVIELSHITHQIASTGTVSSGFAIAGGSPTVANRYLTGDFDDVRVYNGAGDLAFVDGVRLSNLPASQIPEPSSFAALAGLAGLGLAASRRRSRR